MLYNWLFESTLLTLRKRCASVALVVVLPALPVTPMKRGCASWPRHQRAIAIKGGWYSVLTAPLRSR